jgi:hypothetical protein
LTLTSFSSPCKLSSGDDAATGTPLLMTVLASPGDSRSIQTHTKPTPNPRAKPYPLHFATQSQSSPSLPSEKQESRSQ